MHLAFGCPVPSPLKVSEELRGDVLPVLVQINTRHKKQKNFREQLLERLNRFFFFFGSLFHVMPYQFQ